MSLRVRIALATTLAVAIALGIGGAVVYQAAERSLYRQVDESLRDAALREAPRLLRQEASGNQRPGFERGGNLGFAFTILDANGNVLRGGPGDVVVPPLDDAEDVAERGGTRFVSGRYDRTPVRAVVVGLQPGFALQITRSVEEVDESLDRLRSILLVVGLLGVVLAGALAVLVASRGLLPLRRLAGEVEDAARTRDLSRRVPEQGGAESVALASAVNALLAGLEEARAAQDQLVADAAHELRTPLTALRADVESLADPDQPLDDEERRQLAEALDREIAEIALLITGIVDLARGARPVDQRESMRLDDIAADVVARERARHPDATIDLDIDEVEIDGDPMRLERILANLVTNALVHGAAPVQVRIRPGLIQVDDAGPGIPVAERAAVMERFRRGSDAQNRPGSGLGLAIVQQDARAHGGTVEIDDAPGGGCRITVRLPNGP
jgi:two-component system sensor histidine kinase MprB